MRPFGRPRRGESDRRWRALLAELSAGAHLDEAAATAGVAPARVLRMLRDDAFFATYCALRQRPTEVAA